ncbi:MAG: aldo/keto reductase [Capsulimonas sp.]|uniref:aldo/keto reductase n=1 Tax=Capsulimonas sp. TaxID=2494211 RepID=UPI0032660B62
MTMEYGEVLGVDKRVSRLIHGTIMLSPDAIDEGFALLDDVFALGYNTFDTAHVYGGGNNERLFGRWMRERRVRDQVVVVGKGAHHNQDRPRVTPYDITADLHDTLARMQTDYIDIYILHRDDPSVPVGPIVEVLNEHARAGKIGAFGGSNWTHTRIAEANEYAVTNGLTPFLVSNPNYSLAEMVKEPWENCVTISGPYGAEARQWYADNDQILFTWSSLAGGFFSGRFRRDNLSEFTSYFDKLCVECYCYERNFDRLDRAAQLAKDKGATLAQIALAYVLNQPLKIFTLAAAGGKAEAQANVEALGIKLTPGELAWLDLRAETPAG